MLRFSHIFAFTILIHLLVLSPSLPPRPKCEKKLFIHDYINFPTDLSTVVLRRPSVPQLSRFCCCLFWTVFVWVSPPNDGEWGGWFLLRRKTRANLGRDTHSLADFGASANPWTLMNFQSNALQSSVRLKIWIFKGNFWNSEEVFDFKGDMLCGKPAGLSSRHPSQESWFFNQI